MKQEVLEHIFCLCMYTDHAEGIGVGERIVLVWILGKQSGKLCIGFI